MKIKLSDGDRIFSLVIGLIIIFLVLMFGYGCVACFMTVAGRIAGS